MANNIRSAKSGSDWGLNELMAYHITVAPVSPQEFFGQEADPPLAGLDPVLVNSPLDVDLDDPAVSEDTYRFLGYLDLAHTGQESAVDDFSRELLRVCGFQEPRHVLRTRLAIPLSICGNNNAAAQTGVCLMHRRTTILLVLQGDKSNSNPSDPEPQVIAEAIATYQHNNVRRARAGLPILDTMTIPCITMIETRPTFYLVPVTQELSNAVILGNWPEVETKVLKCVTAISDRRLSEGMEAPEYRRVAFQRMIAFRALAKSHWEKFLIE